MLKAELLAPTKLSRKYCQLSQRCQVTGIGLQGRSGVRPGGQPDAARVAASEVSKALARFTGGEAKPQIAPARDSRKIDSIKSGGALER